MEAIKTTVEKITGWRACDGKYFVDEKECKKYEDSAKCAAKAAAMKLTVNSVCADSAFDDFCACCDDEVRVFDIKTVNDLQVVNTYLKIMDKTATCIDPECVGTRVVVRSSYDEWFCVHGTRKQIEERFNTLMDKLFKAGEQCAV